VYRCTCILSVIKAAENYDTIAAGMKDSLDKINALLKDPYIVINEDLYNVELFLCSDYKVNFIVTIYQLHTIHMHTLKFFSIPLATESSKHCLKSICID